MLCMQQTNSIYRDATHETETAREGPVQFDPHDLALFAQRNENRPAAIRALDDRPFRWMARNCRPQTNPLTLLFK